MRTQFLTPMLTALFAATTCGSMAQHTTLSGRILAPTGDSVFVRYQRRMVSEPLASAKLDPAGRFSMRFELDSARSLVFSDGNEATRLFMLPGESLGLTLHTAYFDETLRFTGDGAGRNNTLAALAIADEMNWQSVDALEDTLAIDGRIDAFIKDMGAVLDDYAREFPEMAVLLNGRKAGNEKAAERQKKRIRDGLLFKERAAGMVGKPLIDIVGTGPDGAQVRLSQFKGKTTVVDFWATWCGPCKAEIPHWARLEEQYGDRINFVSVSVWDNEEKWKAMTKELRQTHAMFIPEQENGQLKPYMVSSIPRYMVIDKDLNIITIDAPRPSSPDLVRFF